MKNQDAEKRLRWLKRTANEIRSLIKSLGSDNEEGVKKLNSKLDELENLISEYVRILAK